MRGPGTDYFEAVSRIIAHDRRGMAFRVPFEYLANKSTLELILGETLALTFLSPQDVDVYLDAHSLSLVPTESREELALSEILRTAATALRELRYRTIIFAASNMPDSMTRHGKGTVLRILQWVMGWTDSHAHEFETGAGMVAPDWWINRDWKGAKRPRR